MKYRDFIEKCICTFTLSIVIILLILISSLKCCGQVTLLMPNDGFWYTYTTNDAILYDDGGLNDYANDGLGALTIYPVLGTLTADVGFFDIEFNSTCGWDVFEVYDGDDFSNLIGSYCGTSIPTSFQSTHPTGALTFLWSTDGSVTFPGFEIRIGNFNMSLPITLSLFTVESDGNSVDINWVVQSQINNDYFVIENSLDGEQWKEVDRLDGSGNSNTEMVYMYTDYYPHIGLSYYRLRQVDFDGRSETFNPISVIVKDENTITLNIKPNPAIDHIELEMVYPKEGNINNDLRIYNSSGVIIYKKFYIGKITPLNIDISNFNPGCYVVVSKINNRLIQSKFIKKKK